MTPTKNQFDDAIRIVELFKSLGNHSYAQVSECYTKALSVIKAYLPDVDAPAHPPATPPEGGWPAVTSRIDGYSVKEVVLRDDDNSLEGLIAAMENLKEGEVVKLLDCDLIVYNISDKWATVRLANAPYRTDKFVVPLDLLYRPKGTA